MATQNEIEQARDLAETISEWLALNDMTDAIFRAAPSHRTLEIAAAAIAHLAVEIHGGERAAAIMPVLHEIMRHTIAISKSDQQ